MILKFTVFSELFAIAWLPKIILQLKCLKRKIAKHDPISGGSPVGHC
jgi:hypothetical protein